MTTTEHPAAPILRMPWPDFDSDRDCRFARAIKQVAAIVADRQWHLWSEVMAVVSSDNDLKPSTVESMLYVLVRTGQLQKPSSDKPRPRGSRQIKLSPAWQLAQQHMQIKPGPVKQRTGDD